MYLVSTCLILGCYEQFQYNRGRWFPHVRRTPIFLRLIIFLYFLAETPIEPRQTPGGVIKGEKGEATDTEYETEDTESDDTETETETDTLTGTPRGNRNWCWKERSCKKLQKESCFRALWQNGSHRKNIRHNKKHTEHETTQMEHEIFLKRSFTPRFKSHRYGVYITFSWFCSRKLIFTFT